MSAGKTYTISEEAYANKKAYVAKYSKEKYEHISLTVPMGEKEHYKELAKEKGMSVTQLFISAVKEVYDK